MKAKILKSVYSDINVGDIGEIERCHEGGAAIKFTKRFTFPHQIAKEVTRIYWFNKDEYQEIN